MSLELLLLRVAVTVTESPSDGFEGDKMMLSALKSTSPALSAIITGDSENSKNRREIDRVWPLLM